MKEEKSYKIKYEVQTGAEGKKIYEKMDFKNGKSWTKKIIFYEDYLKNLKG